MDLLEKIRKLNKLLQKERILDTDIISKVLRDVIEANIFVISARGMIISYALVSKYDVSVSTEEVFSINSLSPSYQKYIMSIEETFANVPVNEQISHLPIKGENSSIIPICAKGERLGTLIVIKDKRIFNDEEILLAECAATVLGVEILRESENKNADELRQKATIQIAFSTLSYSEMEAVINILSELKGTEGLLVASKIADRVGITRSVIVNALRKFESAGLIETRSLGMKGTFIKVLSPVLFEELKKRIN